MIHKSGPGGAFARAGMRTVMRVMDHVPPVKRKIVVTPGAQARCLGGLWSDKGPGLKRETGCSSGVELAQRSIPGRLRPAGGGASRRCVTC